MGLWSLRPETGLGWALWSACLAVQLLAVVAIVREVRGRRINGWDVVALLFVTVGGPGPALAFLAVHAFLERRAIRKERSATAPAARAL